jgi:2-polyprenyl-3-methyl-5-hydroxy-6-metoxy-1,4-benzoquinol methylase
MPGAEHWDAVYGSKQADQVSWFQERPETSLRLLSRFASARGSVVDVGAGESFLVDALLDDGWIDVTVLDVSREAVEAVQERLADRAGASFVVSDLMEWKPERQYDAWHDRAVLHFLTEPAQQERYRDVAATALLPGAVAVLGTFAPDGPTTCSGLPTCRYDAPMLSALCGSTFALEHHEREEHRTPWGAVQPFTWVVLRRL